VPIKSIKRSYNYPRKKAVVNVNDIPKYSDKTVSIYNQWVFTGVDKPMFVFGEEKSGLSDYILEKNPQLIKTNNESD
jgi:tRNA(Leu) C34 or U34 (ribose-2'-O)-methylase TrmL